MDSIRRRIPDRSFVLLLVGRGCFIWIAARFFGAWAQVTATGPLMALGFAAIVGIAGLGEARRRGDDLFLANLGTPRSSIVLVSAMTGGMLDLLLGWTGWLS